MKKMLLRQYATFLKQSLFPTSIVVAMLLAPPHLVAQAGTGPGGVGDTNASVELTLWLSADNDAYSDIACTTAATEGVGVACVKDRSSNGSDATQSLVVRQALFRDNVLNATHGKPVLRFDGTNDFMLTNAVPATGAGARTLIAVINDGADNGLAYQHVLHYGSSGFADAYGICFRTNPNQTSGTGSNIGNHYWSLGFSSNQTQTAAPLILNMSYDGSQDELFANGLTQGTRTLTLTTMSTDGVRLGSRVNTTDGAEFFDGDIAEVIAYSDILSTPERKLVDNYLSSKYDIALSSGDLYDGDTVGNGDYDHDVAGIGRDGGVSHTTASSAGLVLTNTSLLSDDGDYLLAGHDSPTNSVVTADLPMGVQVRMDRVWYLDLTDINANTGVIDLAFDFVLAGLEGLPANNLDFHLLARAGTSGDFTSIATSTTKSSNQIVFNILDVAGELVASGPYITVGFVPDADLSITKDDGQTETNAGAMITYTITVQNSGGTPVVDATVTDTFPAEITGVTWTCAASMDSSCSAAGSGDISDTVTVAAGGDVTYTATGTLALTASGDVSNTATVEAPMGSADPNLDDNTDTDTNTVIRQADLSITKTDGETLIEDGTQLTYTIVVANAGPVDTVGVLVDDLFPAALSCSWTCVPSAGATCAAGPVAGHLSDTIDLASGASATYSAVCDVPIDTFGSLSNTATVTAPAGIVDPDTNNNQATDFTLLRKIFLDSFESGDTTAWTNSVSLALVFDLGGARDGLATTFYPVNIDWPKALDRLDLLAGANEDGRIVFKLEGRPAAHGLEWRLGVVDREGIWYNSSWHSIPPESSLVQLKWQRYSEDGKTGGRIQIEIDGALTFDIEGLTDLFSLHQLFIRDFGSQPSLFDWEDIHLK